MYPDIIRSSDIIEGGTMVRAVTDRYKNKKSGHGEEGV